MISFNNVSGGYKEKIVLRDISLDISEGEFLCVIGPNGSGKSTFIRLINGLLSPLSGTVTVDGMDTVKDDLFLIRKKTGTVFQNPDNQIVTALVEDEVAFGPENLMLSPEEINSRVEKALEFTGMLQYKGRMTGNLSGGQKQRVAFASAIAMEPKYCLFDEPTSLIDISGRKQIMDIIKKIHKQGRTIVMVSHFLEEVFMAQRVLVLNRGRQAFLGTPAELLQREEILDILGFPLPLYLEIARKYGLNPSVLDMKHVAMELRRRLS